MSLCTVALYGQSAQPPSQTRTFRSSTALVEVDAIMLDKEGKFVPGLKADDIALFEDGKPQKIQQFYMVTHDFGSAPNAPVSEFADQADFKAHRLFVVLFDEASLANDSLLRAKKGAEQFVREQMAEEDAGGVYSGNGMFRSLLTTDKVQLLAGIHSVKPAFDNRQRLLSTFREFPQISSELDAARIADGAHEVTTQLANDACRLDQRSCAEDGGQQGVENLIQQKAILYIKQSRMQTRQTVDNLEKVAVGLGRLPGRKTVIFVTEGFFVEEARSALEMIAGEAARAGVTIYSIDARGLINSMSPNPDAVSHERARNTQFDTGEDAASILTSGTGGFMVRGVDDMSRAFGRIAHDTSTYYVIGYQPENAKMDGKLRKIEVRTHVPGVTVRARTGYVATDLPPQQSLWGTGK